MIWAASDQPQAAGSGQPQAAGSGPPQAAGSGPPLPKARAAAASLFRTSDPFREQVRVCQKLLADSAEAIMRMDDVCSRPGSAPLREVFAEALVPQEGDVYSVQEMLDVLQQFATEAEAEAMGPQTDYKEGAIVVGRATKHKDKYNEVRCKVLTCNSRDMRVLILEGPAKGEKHKYPYASVRPATWHEASFFLPPEDLVKPPAAASSPAPQAAALPATGGLPPSSLANPAPATGGPSEAVSVTVAVDAGALWGNDGF